VFVRYYVLKLSSDYLLIFVSSAVLQLGPRLCVSRSARAPLPVCVCGFVFVCIGVCGWVCVVLMLVVGGVLTLFVCFVVLSGLCVVALCFVFVFVLCCVSSAALVFVPT